MDSKTRKNNIIEAAGKVFSEKGYSVATVEDIANAAGVAKGSIYNYFTSKQELFTALFLEMMEHDREAEEEIFVADLPASEKLARLMGRWLDRFDEYQHIGRLVLEFWTTAASEEEGPFGSELKRVYRQWHDSIRNIFQEGLDNGEFHLVISPDEATRMLMALFDGIGVQNMLGVGESFGHEHLDNLKKVIFDYLLGGGGNS